MYKIKNSDIPFLTLSKENIFTICNSLENDEIGIIFKAFMDFVYLGIEPTFDKKYMRGIFDGVLQTMERKAEGCFASRENGKKGGRPKKNNTDLQPNTDFEEKAEDKPNKTINPQDNTNIPQEEENAPERLKMPINEEFENTIEEPQIKEEEYMGNYTGIQLNINNTPYPRKEEVVEYRSQNRIPIEKTIPTENTIMEALNKLNAKLPFMKDRIYNTTTKGLDFESNLNRIIESVDKIIAEYLQDKETRIGVYTHIIKNKLQSVKV